MKTAIYLSEKGFRKAKQGTEHEYKRYKDLAEFKPFKYKGKKLPLARQLLTIVVDLTVAVLIIWINSIWPE